MKDVLGVLLAALVSLAGAAKTYDNHSGASLEQGFAKSAQRFISVVRQTVGLSWVEHGARSEATASEARQAPNTLFSTRDACEGNNKVEQGFTKSAQRFISVVRQTVGLSWAKPAPLAALCTSCTRHPWGPCD